MYLIVLKIWEKLEIIVWNVIRQADEYNWLSIS